MTKRIRLIVISLALAVVIGVLLFGFLLPEMNKAPEEVPKETEALVQGEVLGTGGRVQIFPQVKSKEVRSLHIKNQYGEYKIIRKAGNLVIENHENLYLDQEKLIQMIVNAGYTLSTYRSEVEEGDFEKYGLTEDTGIASFELVNTTDDTYKVYVGDRTLDGKGYYVRYEGRNAIYVLDDVIEADLLGPVENIVSTMLAVPTNMNTYYLVPEFILTKENKVVVAAEYLDPADRSELAAMGIQKLLYPENYYASDAYNSVLTKFCDFKASRVMTIDLSDASFEKYGIDLDCPAYALYYKSTILNEEDNVEGFIDNQFAFSEKQKDESGYFYYVYCANFGFIGRIEEITVDFLEWKIDKWVSPYLFQINIVNVDSISFESKDNKRSFKFSGEDNDSLSVVEESGFTPELGQFRNLWKVLLSVCHDGYLDFAEGEREAVERAENKLLTMTVTTRSGIERRYDFYQYTDRRLFYTINGEGEFYVTRTLVDKVISDVERLMNGEEIDPEARF